MYLRLVYFLKKTLFFSYSLTLKLTLSLTQTRTPTLDPNPTTNRNSNPNSELGVVVPGGVLTLHLMVGGSKHHKSFLRTAGKYEVLQR